MSSWKVAPVQRLAAAPTVIDVNMHCSSAARRVHGFRVSSGDVWARPEKKYQKRALSETGAVTSIETAVSKNAHGSCRIEQSVSTSRRINANCSVNNKYIYIYILKTLKPSGG